ncbi:MAG: hypothetical protein HYU69_04455 [Bacteroidetes bacterium]|nr:hypothetical protein [Bacteroidota bacterium]
MNSTLYSKNWLCGLTLLSAIGLCSPGFGQSVGIGSVQFVPVNTLDVKGAVAIGTYAGVNTAPANGFIVPGNIGSGPLTTLPYSLTISTATGSGSFMGIYNGSGTRLTQMSCSGQIFITASGVVDDAGANFTVFRYGADANRIFFGAYGTAAAALSGNSYIISTHNIYFTLNNAAQTTSATPIMMLDGTSKFVGVGTTSPTSKLDINATDGYSQLRIETPATVPSGSAVGNIGDTAWDTGFFYLKTSAGWKRMTMSAF